MGLDPGEVASRIVRLVEPNPRKLKNFVNTLAVGWAIRTNCNRPDIEFHVAPFSREQIRTYLDRWFELRTLRSGQRQETIETLIERLTSRAQEQRLLPLARRPAYLASLAFVQGTRGELPYTRAALYELLVDAYIEMLDRQRGLLDRAEREEELPIWDRQEKVEVLSAVAFQAHVGATVKEKMQARAFWRGRFSGRWLIGHRSYGG